MKNLLEQLAFQLVELLKIKSIVTIIAMIVFAKLSLSGTIKVDNVMLILNTIIIFYFNKKNNDKIDELTKTKK